MARAAASLAQVHRARIISTGEHVVVKGQYPDLVALLDEDFNTVVKMLRLARWIPGSQDFDSWLATLHTQLLAEVDYPREHRMAQAMSDGLSRHAALQNAPVAIRIPQFWPELCSTGVLTMEYIEGHRAASARVAALHQMLEVCFSASSEMPQLGSGSSSISEAIARKHKWQTHKVQ